MAGEVLMRRRALARRDADDALVFPGPKTGRAIHRSLVYRRIKTAVRRAGIRDFGHYCHALRHSFAVAHIEKDTHLRVIQDLLGHGSIRSTEIYARATSTKAQEVMERFDLGEPTES
jgi:site-specific recombinase XerD